MLDGSLIVCQKGKLKIEISADDTAARLPICEANTDEIKLNARKKCRILRFNRNLYDILTTHSDGMSIEFEESDDGTDALFVEIYQAYVGGYLKVPSLPGLALRIRKAVSDPEQFNLQFVLDKLRGQAGAIVINQWGGWERILSKLSSRQITRDVIIWEQSIMPILVITA